MTDPSAPLRILHFALGLPPYRAGGMTRYVQDLMHVQVAAGHMVSLLYPGAHGFHASRIRRRAPREGVTIFELSNPPVVPLLSGISDPARIIRQADAVHDSEIQALLEDLQPDILHIHTLMGIPSRLIRLAKARGTRVVFTTHDYFGLCARTTFLDVYGNTCESPSPERCAECCANAPGYLHSFLYSQPVFHHLKKHLRRFSRGGRPPVAPRSPSNRQIAPHSDFAGLLRYYLDQLSSIDRFHFTSSVSEAAYRKQLPGISGTRIPVTLRSIADHRTTPRQTDSSKIRLGFVGDSAPFKGYSHLTDQLDTLRHEGVENWELHVFGHGHENDPPTPGVFIHGPFEHSQIREIYGELDLLVVPSLWNETFSLVTLEALSFGTPALVHPSVGAKDLILLFAPQLVVPPSRLGTALREFLANPALLREARDRLLATDLPFDHEQHCSRIEHFYSETRGESTADAEDQP